MNYMYNATQREMSKFVDNNRENNEGYYFRMPKHTNNLFVQENSKQIHLFGLSSFAKTGLERKLSRVELCCRKGDSRLCFQLGTQAFRLPWSIGFCIEMEFWSL